MRIVSSILILSILVLALVGCQKSGGVSVGINSSGHTTNDDKKKSSSKVEDNKLVTTTVTTSQKVEELVPPPPVKKITVTTGTSTTSTLNGVPVKPDVQVHETPKVIDPAQFGPAK